MKENSSLFKFFSLKPVTVFALAVATILALVLSACAPIPESERLPPLQPGYERIIVSISGVGGRAVTDEDKDTAKYKVFFNGILSETGPHGVFKVGSTVNIRVEGYRKDTDEQIGIGTASHTMIYGTNRATVTLGPVSGSYILRYSYGEAENLPGKKEGLPSGTEFYESGEEVTPPNADIVTWDHGDLAGWNYDDGSGEQPISAIPFQMPSAETKLVAQWTRHKYDLTYEDNIPSEATQGASVSGKPTDQSQQDALSEITVGTEIPTLTASNQQWTFKHWTLTQADSGTRYSAGDKITLTDHTTLYAQWTNEAVWRLAFAEPTAKPTAYTTNMPQGNIVQQGKAFTWTANPAARGWSFDGWDVTGSTTISSPLSATTTQVTPDADITLTARWTPIEYTVKFTTGNGSAVNDIANFTVNGSDSFAANPTYTGYTFGGWQYNSTPIADAAALRTAITNGSVTASGNNEITLTAQWTVNTYRVKYEPNAPSGATVMLNGATATTQEVERTYGQSFSWASNMFTAPNGYSFASWNTQENGNGTTLTGTATSDYINRTDEITVYAKWTEKDYTVTYSGGSGSTGSQAGQTISVASKGGELPTKDDTSLSKTGYTLAGWEYNNARYDDLAALRAAISDGTITVTSITLTAVWQVAYKTDKSTWAVGDIIIQKTDDNAVVAIHRDVYTARDTTAYGDGVAVVYKNADGKVYIMGKNNDTKRNELKWCLDTADGYNTDFTALHTTITSSTGALNFEGYQNGIEGWSKLTGTAGVTDTATEGNYPAWEYCNNYGTTKGLKGDLATGWYLPSIAEVRDIYTEMTKVNASQKAIGVINFELGTTSLTVWSSSQSDSDPSKAIYYSFTSGYESTNGKNAFNDVYAVRQFTY